MIRSDDVNNELDKLVFSTKSIMITDKQKEFIEQLLDELIDFGDDSYNSIEYWKLSKQDATKLIKELKSLVDDYESEFYDDRYDYDSMDYGDR